MPMNGRWAGRRLKPVKPRRRKLQKGRAAKAGVLGSRNKRATKAGGPKRKWSGQRVTIRSQTKAKKADGHESGIAVPPWISGHEAAVIRDKPTRDARGQAPQPSKQLRRRRAQPLRPSKHQRKRPGKTQRKLALERAMRQVDHPSRDSDDILRLLGWTWLPDGTPVPPP